MACEQTIEDEALRCAALAAARELVAAHTAAARLDGDHAAACDRARRAGEALDDAVAALDGAPVSHAERVAAALEAARAALASAVAHGRRADCLRAAVGALEGALRCVRAEDEAAAGAAAGGSHV
jgi:hypothetical protein